VPCALGVFILRSPWTYNGCIIIIIIIIIMLMDRSSHKIITRVLAISCISPRDYEIFILSTCRYDVLDAQFYLIIVFLLPRHTDWQRMTSSQAKAALGICCETRMGLGMMNATDTGSGWGQPKASQKTVYRIINNINIFLLKWMQIGEVPKRGYRKQSCW
jgi:hypothetical protein